MKLKYKKSRLNYTLVEILAAMGVFMIIALVVMRFFSGAQKLTSSTNSYNEMYADVRAFFNIIGNDLQTIVYNNSVSTKGHQPFVLSYYDISSALGTHFEKPYPNIAKFYAQTLIPPHFKDDMALKDELAADKVPYVPLLCFIANPSNVPSSASSSTCEVRYTFIPIGATPTKQAKFDYSELGSAIPNRKTAGFKFGGKILRSLTYDDSKKPSAPSYAPKRYPLDYDLFPIVDDAGVSPKETGAIGDPKRIEWVFGDESSCKYEEVIGQVYRMNITCYKLEADATGEYSYKKYKFRKMDGSSSQLSFVGDTSSYITWPPTASPIYYPSPPAAIDTLIKFEQLGHPLPDMVRVDLYVLTPQDWNLLMNYYDWTGEKFTDEAAAKRLLERKMRHFSRVFRINIKE